MLTYEQLSADQFRLLTLKPLNFTPSAQHGPSGSAIEIYCELKPCLREPPPTYITLSYVWGTSKTRKHIYVNDVICEVRPNLEAALRFLRLPDKDLVLWIDAICINQQYSKEQAAQVRHMKNIYSNSLKTIVWLGPPVMEGGIDTDACIKTMNEIGEKMIAVDAVGAITTMSILSNGEDVGAYETVVSDVNDKLDSIFIKDDGPSLRSLMSGFRFLSAVPYWTRVWTQQEIAVAKCVEFAVGGARISFSRFRACVLFMGLWQRYMFDLVRAQIQRAETLDYTYWTKEFFQPMTSNIGKPIGLRAHYQQGNEQQKFGLVHLLVRAHVTSDSDPRCDSTLSVDRIFGLLGVANDADTFDIEINYEVPTEVVYTKVARALIEAGHVDLLAYCQFHPLEIEDVILRDGKIVRKAVENIVPSWVPDWRRELRRPCGEYIWDTAFQASEPHKYQLLPSGPGHQFDILKLKGIRIDVIEATGNHWRPKTIDTPPLELIAPYLAEIQDFCFKSNSKQENNTDEIYVNPSDRADAHYRIPIADQEMTNIGFRRRASSTAEEGYTKVLEDTKGSPNLEDRSVAKGSYLNMMGYLYFRRPFISGKGFVGLAPESVEVGDIVCVFLGGKLPYILRERADGKFRLIGEAYVHGIMYGEAWEAKEPPNLEIFEMK